jgi:hypothetical protein
MALRLTTLRPPEVGIDYRAKPSRLHAFVLIGRRSRAVPSSPRRSRRREHERHARRWRGRAAGLRSSDTHSWTPALQTMQRKSDRAPGARRI